MGYKILMVCHGNICRSPLAEALLKDKIKKLNILNTEVDSAGTSNYYNGQPPDHRTLANALEHNIDASAHRSRQFKGTDFAKYDRIYVMDSANYADIMLLADSDADRKKVKLLLSAARPEALDSVPDPWYGDKKGFEKVYRIIDKACATIAQELKKNNLP